MIQNHPFCPKSAMEKYYMEQQLPEYQTVPASQVQKKNHSYYHENTHIWNNQHQSSSNMKVFSKIMEQNKRGDKRIQHLQQQEHRDKQLLEMSKRIYFNHQREEDLMRMQTRKLERAGLQNLSSQQSDLEAEQLLIKKIQPNATLQGRPEFIWNKVGSQSQKHIRMLVNPKILAMEEEAVKLIEKRIEKEQQIEQIKNDLKQENMKRIRELNGRRQQENAGMQLKKSNGRKPSLEQIEEHPTGRLSGYEKPSDKPSFSFNVRPSTSMQKQEQSSLSVNKHRHLRIDRSEFKGLYVAQACDLSDNNFNRTIRSNCPELFDGISKPRLVHPTRKEKQHHQEHVEDINKILDSFENKLKQ